MTNERHAELAPKIIESEIFATAIYYDMLTNIDGLGVRRTQERYTGISQQYGDEILFGIMVNWANHYFELSKAALDLVAPGTPLQPPVIKLSEATSDRVRAYNIIQQFYSAVFYEDLEMAYDLYLAANSVLEIKPLFFMAGLVRVLNFGLSDNLDDVEEG